MQALLVIQAGMQHGNRCARKAALKPVDQLRRKANFRYQYQRLAVVFQQGRNDAQVNLGFTTAGDTVQ